MICLKGSWVRNMPLGRIYFQPLPEFLFSGKVLICLISLTLHYSSLLLYSSLLSFLHLSFPEHSVCWSSHPIPSLLAWELKQVPTSLVFKALTLQAPGFLLFPAPEALSSTCKSGDPHTDFLKAFAWESLLGIGTHQGPCLLSLGSHDTSVDMDLPWLWV